VVQEYAENQSASSLDDMSQVSTTQEITIATRLDLNDAPTVELQLAFLSPADLSERPNIDSITFAGIRNVPESPWAPTQRVLIEGRLYQLRSAQIDISNLHTNGVEAGNPFYFKTMKVGLAPAATIEADDVYLMLTTAPYESVDKNYDNIIDMSTADANSAASSFVYRDRELFAFNTVLINLYPPVQVSL
jgi:hypothetical protein